MGGLLILGKAPCSFKSDVTELQIEGIPTSDTNGFTVDLLMITQVLYNHLYSPWRS